VNDDELEQLAQRLGAQGAERLDVERTVQAVVAGLRRRHAVPAWSWVALRPAGLKVAALLVLALGAGVVTRSLWRQRRPPAPVVVPLEEDLTGLTADQLREAIDSLDRPLGEESAGLPEAELDGLSADELRALLRALEG